MNKILYIFDHFWDIKYYANQFKSTIMGIVGGDHNE